MDADTLASRISVLELPIDVIERLDTRMRAALVVLAENGDVRATDLGAALEMSAGRVSMFMTRLRRELHQVGVECFTNETATDGEPRFVYTPAGGR